MTEKTITILREITDIFSEHGFGDWHLEIKDVTSYHAMTKYKQKKFVYSSRAFAMANRDQIRGITMHELAHALVGPGHRHDRTFKAKYYELTGDMDYAGYSTPLNTGDYLCKCPECGDTGSTNAKKGRKKYCRNCYENKRRMVELELTKNPLNEVAW